MADVDIINKIIEQQTITFSGKSVIRLLNLATQMEQILLSSPSRFGKYKVSSRNMDTLTSNINLLIWELNNKLTEISISNNDKKLLQAMLDSIDKEKE